jgi:hypothetical protein
MGDFIIFLLMFIPTSMMTLLIEILLCTKGKNK